MRRVRKPWTPEQEAKLEELLTDPTLTYKDIATVIGRTPASVCARMAAIPRLTARKAEVIADYRAGTISVVQMAAKYGISNDTITTQLKRWGVYDPAREFTFINRRSQYDCWVETYGKEGADIRYAEYCASHQRGARKGVDNPMYGKMPGRGTGNGWKGWYRDQYFRSLREATYMIELDREGVNWVTGETLHIPYTLNGKPSTYHPDYIVGTTVVEIKPARLHNTPRVAAKQAAAELYCRERGLTYQLVDVTINAQAIHAALTAGTLRFDRDYEARFMLYVQRHSPLSGVLASPPRSMAAEPNTSSASE